MASVPVIFIPSSPSKSSSSNNYRSSTQTPIQPDYHTTVTRQPPAPPTPAEVRAARETEQFCILLAFALLFAALVVFIAKSKRQ